MIANSRSTRTSILAALALFATILAAGCNRPAEEVEPTPPPLETRSP